MKHILYINIKDHKNVNSNALWTQIFPKHAIRVVVPQTLFLDGFPASSSPPCLFEANNLPRLYYCTQDTQQMFGKVTMAASGPQSFCSSDYFPLTHLPH